MTRVQFVVDVSYRVWCAAEGCQASAEAHGSRTYKRGEGLVEPVLPDGWIEALGLPFCPKHMVKVVVALEKVGPSLDGTHDQSTQLHRPIDTENDDGEVEP